jgi:hypothetical protein
MSSPSSLTLIILGVELSSDTFLAMSEYDSSLRSGQLGYDRNKAFKPYRTGTFDPEQARADMRHEQSGIDVRNERHRGSNSSRPEGRHTHPRHDRRSSQASPYDSDETVRQAPPRSSTSTRRRKPSSKRPQSPAPSAQQSRSTARRLPPQDDRQQSPPNTQTSTLSEPTFGDPLSSRQQLPIYNDTSGQRYDFPSANFETSSNAGSSRHGSRRVSSPQGPGKGFDSRELQRRMVDLSISGNSGTRSHVSGGSYNQSLVPSHQQSDQRPPTDLSPYTIDTGPPNIRDRLRAELLPIREAMMPFIPPDQYIAAQGASVIAQERLLDRIEGVLIHNKNTACSHDAGTGSLPLLYDVNSTSDRRSRRAEGNRQLLEAPAYTNSSQRSARPGALLVHGDPPPEERYYTERAPSFASQQSSGRPRQPRTANPRDVLQLERYEGIHPSPSSQSRGSTYRPECPAFGNFGDQESMHSAGTQNSRGPSMQSFRGGRDPGPFDEGRYYGDRG